MKCEDQLEQYTILIQEVLKDLNLDYTLEYILENFMSIILAKEEKRIRIAAVLKIDTKKTKRIDIKKTKRIYIKTISFKDSDTALANIEIITKSGMLVQLYRSIKILQELESLKFGLEGNNTQLKLNGKIFYEELGFITGEDYYEEQNL